MGDNDSIDIEITRRPVPGEVRLRRMSAVFTAGHVINAKTARSQAIGGMIAKMPVQA